MCTVTYIAGKNGTTLLTQGRDELVRRELTTPPIEKIINGSEHIFPVDPNSGGTWIGMAENNRIACIMNGGTHKYKPNHPYRKNSGLIIPAFFEFRDFYTFYNEYDFKNIEPFTLIVIENGKLIELFKDADSQFFNIPDPGNSRIYSSVNLFSEKQILEKELKFNDWLNDGSEKKPDDIINLHNEFRIDLDGPVPVKGDQDMLRTVSITTVYNTGRQLEMIYLDLINDFRFSKFLKIKKEGIAA
jgi:hypothetical protein